LAGNSSFNSSPEGGFVSPDYDIKRIPYSLEAEMSVLGAVLIYPDKYEEIAEILSADDFYLPNHRDIYESITRLYLKNRSIDLVILLDDISSKGPRPDDSARNTAKEYLMRLSDSVPVAGNIKEYAAIVREKSLRRKLITVSGEITKMAYEDASSESALLIDRAEQMIFALAQRGITQDFVHVRNIMASVFANIHNVENNREAASGLSSGFSGIDSTLVGMNAGDLILIGARPSMGKTAFAMNIAMNAASKDKTVAAFQLEMSKEQIVSRILSSESFVDNTKLRSGFLSDDDWAKITEAGSRISECDIYIDDTPGMTVTAMKAKLRKFKKLDLVIIDHLQLMQTDKNTGNRVQEISEISRNLKIMAKELAIPVIACAQLHRGPESRDDKRPMLSDLRESGSIEQDADVVMFLYRDEYYKESIEKHNRAEIIFAKNRHGAIGKVEVGFEKKFTRFYDIDEVHKE